MIKLLDACILDGLSDAYRAVPWIQAFSFACKKMQDIIFTYINRLRIWSNIDDADDVILNALAIELRVISYDESFSREKRLELVKSALVQWANAGTKTALEDIATLIFEDATVVEWYEYNGNPMHFKIQTTNPNVNGDVLEQLKEVIKDYKRLCTTLDEVEIITSIEPMFQIYGMPLLVAEIETLPEMLEK